MCCICYAIYSVGVVADWNAHSYTPFDEGHPGTFNIGLKSQFSLESVMLNSSLRGLCFYSSSLVVNDADRIAILHVASPNEEGRFAPGTAFLLLDSL